jgi:hypothetical protein
MFLHDTDPIRRNKLQFFGLTATQSITCSNATACSLSF